MKIHTAPPRNRIPVWLLLAFLVLLPLQACAPAPTAEPTELPATEPVATEPVVTPAPDEVKVVVLPFTSHGPLFIAQEEGFFADENLAVEFVRFDDGAKAFPALVQGDVDASASAPTIAFFNAIAQGSTVTMVADRGNLAGDACTYMALLATPAWIEEYNASPVDALKDVKVAVGTTNFEAFMFEQILIESGLTLEDTLTQDIAPPALSEAVQNGAVEVISVGEPWVTRLLDTGLVTVWKPYQEVVPGMQFGALLYGPGMLERPEVGVRFLTAYLRAVHQYNEGKTERNVAIMAQYTELDVDLLQRACWPPMQDDGLITTDTVAAYQEWALSKGLIDQLIPVESYWDPSFLEQLTP